VWDDNVSLVSIPCLKKKNHHHMSLHPNPTNNRRISQGRDRLKGRQPITQLKDLYQPFVFELRARTTSYRLEFYDKSSPENWRLVKPDIVVLCYDITQRLSLINLQRVVCLSSFARSLNLAPRPSKEVVLTSSVVDQGSPPSIRD
jgi:hypothetical protein